MQRFAIVMLAALTAAPLAVSAPVDAKRLGGGGSLGTQRQSVAPRPPSAPSGAAAQPVMPAQPGAALPAKPVAPPAAAPSGMSRWLGPIAGIAAGLGLAALLSHFGLPEGFGSLLLLGLLAVGAFVLLRMFLARRQAAAPMQYAGAGPGSSASAADDLRAPAWASE